MTARDRVLASTLSVLVPLKGDVRTRRYGGGLHARAREAVYVAGDVRRGDVGDWVVVWRDSDEVVLTLVNAVDPDVLHRD